ncbi:MAG: PDZ domain-containing protein [Cyanobacteria bacterium SZAS LIN-2]|nr:PDZ domain-containing protein [Cyanobacteria bacterium SZAS LIN-2]MBS2006481.1 PDZ domain-containing protein [Cyanobacteria bacterium SZAS TMP-1]
MGSIDQNLEARDDGNRGQKGNEAPVFDPMSIFSKPVPRSGSLDGKLALSPQANLDPKCPSNPDYIAFIDAAARNIYDPKELGDIESLKHRYDCDIRSTADVFKYADQSLAVTGDRFNHAMSPAEAKQFDRVVAGSYTGIGLEIVPAEAAGGSNVAATLVKRPVPGRPAEQAGLQPGDAILEIDGKDVHTMSPAEISDRITNGRPGTQVDIVVDRKGERVEKLVTRQAIEAPPVVHDQDLGDGIAYIKIDNFGTSTEAAQLAEAMDKHKNARAFVVDVRDNPGGLVDQSLKSAELFVKSGVLMTSRQRHDSSPAAPSYDETTYEATSQGLNVSSFNTASQQRSRFTDSRLPYKAADRPVVVLTNGKSASASEIFTGALHDTAHDTVIGTTTFGKGIGQSLVKNVAAGGYLKVTSLHYLTPSGFWPGDADKNKFGIKEDIHIDNPEGAKPLSADDAQLSGAVAYLKTRLLQARPAGR